MTDLSSSWTMFRTEIHCCQNYEIKFQSKFPVAEPKRTHLIKQVATLDMTGFGMNEHVVLLSEVRMPSHAKDAI